MIYTIGSQKIDVPETGPERKIRTPRQVVPWRDVAETCRTLDAICSVIEDKPRKIIDGIARAGFWGAVFRDHWPKCKLLLNEEDPTCMPILKKNFPDDVLYTKNIKNWTPPKADISLLDFDHFTLRILSQWENVLKRWSPKARYFIIADGACFGWKFGNMKHYGINDPEKYFYLLDRAMAKFIDKRITTVSSFANASTILLEDVKPRNIKFLSPSKLYLSRGGKVYTNVADRKAAKIERKGLFDA